MARAVVPRTAAAVDHADTELIGHDGNLGDTGFLCSGTIWWSSNLNSLSSNLSPQFSNLNSLKYTLSDPHAVSSYNLQRRAGRKRLHWPELPRRRW